MTSEAKQHMDPSMQEMAESLSHDKPPTARTAALATKVSAEFQVTEENRGQIINAFQQIAQYNLAPEVVRKQLNDLPAVDLQKFLTNFKGTEALGYGLIRALNGSSGLAISRDEGGTEHFVEMPKIPPLQPRLPL